MPRPSKTSIIIAVSCDVLKLQTVYVESFNCGLTKLGYVSAVYLGIWLKGSEIYIHVGSVSLVQGQKVFKIRPVNSKSRSPRNLLKRIPAGVPDINYQKPRHLYL